MLIQGKALEVLGDYLFELETRDRRRGRSYGQDRTLSVEPVEVVKREPTPLDRANEYQATLWEKKKVEEWKEQGRITADGRLRVGTFAIKPYTLDDVRRTWEHLGVYDRIAVLIELDGVVEEGFMEAHEQIREVVQRIAKEQVEKYLSTPEGQAVVAEVAYQQLGVTFGRVLEQLKSDSTMRPAVGGKRQNRCSNCGTPGHRNKTCPHSKEDGAAMRAAAADAQPSDS